MDLFTSIFSILLLGTFSSGQIRISLNSNELKGTWTVWNQNKSINIIAKVPGGIYTDLQSAGILDDNLFYRFNDIYYREIAKENWTYQACFDVSSNVLNKRAINLVFHGIDTVGDIFLNGNFLISVHNMFVRHVLPVKDLIREKNNILEIRFKSPIYEANRLAGIQKKLYPVPPECTPESYNGECHVNFLRKMQASFAWDWGPAFPSVGIWKSVEIEAFDLGIIRDITAKPYKVNSTLWKVNATFYVEFAEDEIPQHITHGYLSKINSNERVISDVVPNEQVISEAVFEDDKAKDPNVKNGYVYNAQFSIPQAALNLWWPNGVSNRALYNLTITIKTLDGAESSKKTIKTGLRVIELVQEALQPEQPGLSFYFKVNDIPIFAKGSNWIPGHILPELSYNEEMIRQALQSVKDANMNMLRVWGGGLYESDIFYEVADELGILIWQDMMFACSMYPTGQDFLDSVKTEIWQQVRRLQHHPSIAIWAGNNENEAALRGNWYGTAGNFSLYKEDYIKLYVDTIKPVLFENDETRPYVISSPSNGIQSEEEGYVASNPYSALYGDVHYYNYIFDGWTDYAYPDTRFASEYGFQSMPSFQSISKVSLPGDRNLQSNFTKKRQHLPLGNTYMMNLIAQQLPLPKDDGSEEYYKTFIYYSQISQAMSTKTETEKYLRDRNKLTAENKGRTMGAMYWQLNDVWQAPSWSSIEFGGKWKMLHYYAKKFFSPILVSPERTPRGTVNVYLVSDLLTDIPDACLTTYVYSWDNFTPRKILSSLVFLNKTAAVIRATYNLSEILKDSNCDKYTCFIYFTVEGQEFYSDNVLYPSRLFEVKNLFKPILTFEVVKTANPAVAKVKVSTDKIAPFVWLETEEDGEFSDNGFLLLKPNIDITFKNRFNRSIDIDNLKSTLKVRSLL